MPESLTSALVQLALALSTAATIAITTLLIPYLRSRIGDQKLQTAATLAERVVRMVEQTSEGKSAESKLGTATVELDHAASRLGINLSYNERQSLVEAAVHDLRLVWSEVNAPPLPALTPENQPDALVPRVDYSTVGAATKPARKTAPKAKVAKETTNA